VPIRCPDRAPRDRLGWKIDQVARFAGGRHETQVAHGQAPAGRGGQPSDHTRMAGACPWAGSGFPAPRARQGGVRGSDRRARKRRAHQTHLGLRRASGIAADEDLLGGRVRLGRRRPSRNQRSGRRRQEPRASTRPASVTMPKPPTRPTSRVTRRTLTGRGRNGPNGPKTRMSERCIAAPGGQWYWSRA
jgi:hypothetical protein